MKKSSKVMLLTAAVVGVVGIGMSIGGVAMGATIAGLNLSKYGFDGIVKQTAKYISLDDKDDWEQDWDEITQLEPVETDNDKEIFETAPISDLKLSLSGDELKFRSYDGDKLRIEVSGSKKDKIRIGTEDDSLILETTGRTRDREITVSYPKNVRFKETSIEVAAGTVTMCDEFRTDDLDVSVAAGEFTNTGKIRKLTVVLEMLILVFWEKKQTTIIRFPVRREMWILATALTAVSDIIRISRTQMPKEI